jgi:ribokinase
MSVLVLGSINTDITSYGEALPRIGETVMGKSYAMELGGKGANQAAAAARLGAKVEFVGRIGDDAFGERALQRLAEFGVSTRHSTRDAEHATGLAIIGVDAQGRNAITVIPGANMCLGAQELREGLRALERAKVLMLQLEIPVAACLEAARAARERGVIVVLDPAPAPSAPLPDALYPLIDVITPNETEAEALLGFRPGTVEEAGRAARELVARGVRAAPSWRVRKPGRTAKRGASSLPWRSPPSARSPRGTVSTPGSRSRSAKARTSWRPRASLRLAARFA